LRYTDLPYHGDSYICVNGTGNTTCDVPPSRVKTLEKVTALEPTAQSIGCAYNLPYTSKHEAAIMFDNDSGYTTDFFGT